MPGVGAGDVILHWQHLLLGTARPAPATSEVMTFQLGETVALSGLGETAQAVSLARQTSSEEETLTGGLPRLLSEAAAPQYPAVSERQPGAAHHIPRQGRVVPAVAPGVVAGDGLVVDDVQRGPRQHQAGTCRQSPVFPLKCSQLSPVLSFPAGTVPGP